MHPELLSLSLFMLGTSCSPGPNNIVASYSGFNFGVVKTFPHMLGVIFGFTSMVCVLNFGLINIFKIYFRYFVSHYIYFITLATLFAPKLSIITFLLKKRFLINLILFEKLFKNLIKFLFLNLFKFIKK